MRVIDDVKREPLFRPAKSAEFMHDVNNFIKLLLCMQDVRSIVVSVNEDTSYVVFVCAMSRYGTGRIASLRFSTPRLNPPVVTPPSTHSLFTCILRLQ